MEIASPPSGVCYDTGAGMSLRDPPGSRQSPSVKWKYIPFALLWAGTAFGELEGNDHYNDDFWAKTISTGNPNMDIVVRLMG